MAAAAGLTAQMAAQAPALGARRPPAQRPEDAATAAVHMFAEAREAIAAEPAVSVPEYETYLAHQEIAEGEGALAISDFQSAFTHALALPDAGLAAAVKREVEPDVIETAIERGDFGTAEKLASAADEGRAAIFDFLIPALLDAGQADAAWAAWQNYRPQPGEYAFHAAATLLQAPGDASRKTRLAQAAEKATYGVGTLSQAEEAMDFLEAEKKLAPSKTAFEAAVRHLAAALPGLQGAAAWETVGLEKRAADLASLRGLPPPDAAAADAAPSRAAPPDALPYTVDQAGELWRKMNAYWPNQDLKPLSELPQSLADQAPTFALALARHFYDRGQMDAFHGTLTRALRATDAWAAKPRAPGQVNFNSVELMVYGRAAQMDFATTREHVEALPAGWLKPLALAYVARFATIAAANHPGSVIQLYH